MISAFLKKINKRALQFEYKKILVATFFVIYFMVSGSTANSISNTPKFSSNYISCYTNDTIVIIPIVDVYTETNPKKNTDSLQIPGNGYWYRNRGKETIYKAGITQCINKYIGNNGIYYYDTSLIDSNLIMLNFFLDKLKPAMDDSLKTCINKGLISILTKFKGTLFVISEYHQNDKISIEYYNKKAISIFNRVVIIDMIKQKVIFYNQGGLSLRVLQDYWGEGRLTNLLLKKFKISKYEKNRSHL